MVDITKFNTNLKSYITTTAFTVAITPNLIKTGGTYVCNCFAHHDPTTNSAIKIFSLKKK